MTTSKQFKKRNQNIVKQQVVESSLPDTVKNLILNDYRPYVVTYTGDEHHDNWDILSYNQDKILQVKEVIKQNCKNAEEVYDASRMYLLCSGITLGNDTVAEKVLNSLY